MDLSNVEIKTLVLTAIIWIVVIIPLSFVTVRFLAEVSLKARMKTLQKSGLTRQEVRAKIKALHPLPWNLRLLVWLKYRNTDYYHVENFMKSFSRKVLGTAPEPKTET